MSNRGKEGTPAEYLAPRDQLLIGALVNRLCGIKEEDFNQNIHPQIAQDIVNALDSRVKITKSHWTANISTPKSSTVTGTTEHGTVNVSSEEEQKNIFELGEVFEYRIGTYVVRKYSGNTSSSLEFEHFWDRGEVNDAFEIKPQKMNISYNKLTLKISDIKLLLPTTLNLHFLTITG